MIDTQDFWEWLDYGKNKGWISEISCVVHDFVDLTDEEQEEYENFYEVCIPVVRLYAQETLL